MKLLTNFSAIHRRANLRGESKTAANKKINENFLFGGFIASYESLCVIKSRNTAGCFVSTVVRKLPL